MKRRLLLKPTRVVGLLTSIDWLQAAVAICDDLNQWHAVRRGLKPAAGNATRNDQDPRYCHLDVYLNLL